MRKPTRADIVAEIKRLKTPSGYHVEGDPESWSSDYDSILQDAASCSAREDHGKAFFDTFECFRYLGRVHVSFRIVDGEAVDIVEHTSKEAAESAVEEMNKNND